jgi:hypothetical protein
MSEEETPPAAPRIELQQFGGTRRRPLMPGPATRVPRRADGPDAYT